MSCDTQNQTDIERYVEKLHGSWTNFHDVPPDRIAAVYDALIKTDRGRIIINCFVESVEHSIESLRYYEEYLLLRKKGIDHLRSQAVALAHAPTFLKWMEDRTSEKEKQVSIERN